MSDLSWRWKPIDDLVAVGDLQSRRGNLRNGLPETGNQQRLFVSRLTPSIPWVRRKVRPAVVRNLRIDFARSVALRPRGDLIGHISEVLAAPAANDRAVVQRVGETKPRPEPVLLDGPAGLHPGSHTSPFGELPFADVVTQP